MTRLFSAWVLVVLASCSSPMQVSSGSNWVSCTTVSDCASVPEAVACNEGYCVDSSGRRVGPSTAGNAAASRIRSVREAGSDTTAADGAKPQPSHDAAGPDSNSGPSCPGVDTSTDPSNCGACGNVCGATVLASGQFPTGGIAVDATSVYWTNSPQGNVPGAVMKLPLSGGAPVTLAIGGPGQSNGFGAIAVDGTSAYWTESLVCEGGFCDAVMKASLTGRSPMALATSQPSVYAGILGLGAVALDRTSAYWTSSHWDGSSAASYLLKVPLAGGPPVMLALGESYIQSAIAVDATSVYWTESPRSCDGGSCGAVMKVSLTGGNPATLASGQPAPRGDIAVDRTSVYWTNQASGWSAGTVMKLPLTGGSPVTLASGQAFAYGASFGYNGQTIAVDATSVYWTTIHSDINGTGGAVMRVPLAGGTPVTLFSSTRDYPEPFVAVDATNVYWATSATVPVHGVSDGKIMKMPLAGSAAVSCQSGVCK